MESTLGPPLGFLIFSTNNTRALFNRPRKPRPNVEARRHATFSNHSNRNSSVTDLYLFLQSKQVTNIVERPLVTNRMDFSPFFVGYNLEAMNNTQ